MRYIQRMIRPGTTGRTSRTGGIALWWVAMAGSLGVVPEMPMDEPAVTLKDGMNMDVEGQFDRLVIYLMENGKVLLDMIGKPSDTTVDKDVVFEGLKNLFMEAWTCNKDIPEVLANKLSLFETVCTDLKISPEMIIEWMMGPFVAEGEFDIDQDDDEMVDFKKEFSTETNGISLDVVEECLAEGKISRGFFKIDKNGVPHDEVFDARGMKIGQKKFDWDQYKLLETEYDMNARKLFDQIPKNNVVNSISTKSLGELLQILKVSYSQNRTNNYYQPDKTSPFYFEGYPLQMAQLIVRVRLLKYFGPGACQLNNVSISALQKLCFYRAHFGINYWNIFCNYYDITNPTKVNDSNYQDTNVRNKQNDRTEDRDGDCRTDRDGDCRTDQTHDQTDQTASTSKSNQSTSSSPMIDDVEVRFLISQLRSIHVEEKLKKQQDILVKCKEQILTELPPRPPHFKVVKDLVMETPQHAKYINQFNQKLNARLKEQDYFNQDFENSQPIPRPSLSITLSK